MNVRAKILQTEILSSNWYTLRKYIFEYQRKDGQVEIQNREAYDRGNGATILLFNPHQGTIILTRQFRMPTFTNGNPDGMLIEACAGLLEEEDAEGCIRRETEEETGYQVKDIKKIFQAYMSPGSVTEMLHFFIGKYEPSMKVKEGGGVAREQEEIEVLEIPFVKAISMIQSGEICDAKTILLIQYAQLNKLMPF